MGSDILRGKKALSDEQIKKYKAQLSKAKPYTYEEIVSIEYDTLDFDFERMEAYNAQMALREAGIIE